MSESGKLLVRRPRDDVARVSDVFHAAACGSVEWLSSSLKSAQKPLHADKHGVSALHIAALYGHVECVRLLLDAGGVVDVNGACPRGRRPLHMVLTSQSRPNTHTCLTHLLEHGAQTNVRTDEGLTPLHVAAAEGLSECTETLVRNEADPLARDDGGHTAFDLARIWGHRATARFLRDAMWKKAKEQEVEKHKQLRRLRQDMATEGREQMLRLAIQKQHPINVKQTSCQRAEPKMLNHARKPHPGKPRENRNVPPIPPLRGGHFPLGLDYSVRLACWKDGPPLPDLPLNDLLRGLFPSAFPSRLQSPRDYQSSSVLDLPRLGRTLKPNRSMWTEVAMHLSEELQPGHY